MAIRNRSALSKSLAPAMPSELPVTFLSVWTLGLALGLTACTVTCLPFMGTWALGRNTDAGGVWRDTLAFLAGRLVSYTALGGLAGVFGAWFVRELAGGLGNLLIGLSGLVAALWLAWPEAGSEHAGCAARRQAATGSPFLLGVALTLIPCAPLTTLLATCAAGESLSGGALYGAAFGAGAVITPMLVLIPACGGFGRILREQGAWLAPWIRYGAAAVMLLLAGRRLALFDVDLALGLPAVAVLLLFFVGVRRKTRGKSRRVIPINLAA